jgi:hypothetical protein
VVGEGARLDPGVEVDAAARVAPGELVRAPEGVR